jgi:hypothetical protein
MGFPHDGDEMTETPQVRTDMDPDMPVPPGVDPNVPSPARMYDYYLGGTYNYQCDRDAAERIRAQMPDLQDAAWANRGFHQRAATWIAEQGIRQFIDIGSGLPTVGNTHEVVQKVHPGARVVYVDNDPIVAAHAAELLAGSHTATLIQADLRDPGTVLGDREMRELIDFTEPAGLLMTAVVHFVADDEDPWGLLARYIGALAPGSYLALSHVTYEGLPPRTVRAGRDEYARATQNIHLRSRADIARFFSGLELVPPYEGAEPDLAFAGLWGAEDPELADSDGSRAFYCGVARRP